MCWQAAFFAQNAWCTCVTREIPPLRKERAVGRLFQSRGLRVETRFYYMDTANPAAIERVLLAVAQGLHGLRV